MRILILVLFSLICTASSWAQWPVVSTNASPYPGTSTNQIHAGADYVVDDKHVLQTGDQIYFQILEDKRPGVNLPVTDSGEIGVPYIGRITAAGKTCRELAAELKVLLEKDYYYRATVIIGLNYVNKVRGQVLIWGEVKTPGAVDLPIGHNLTAGLAILRVGGFGDYADKKRVKIVRTLGPSEKKVFEVNLADMMEKGNTEKDMVLEPGDYIIVSSRLIRF